MHVQFFNSSRAGPRYFRGSNSSGCSAKTFLIAAVIARRPSESILILQTADFAAEVVLQGYQQSLKVFHQTPR